MRQKAAAPALDSSARSILEHTGLLIFGYRGGNDLTSVVMGLGLVMTPFSFIGVDGVVAGHALLSVSEARRRF